MKRSFKKIAASILVCAMALTMVSSVAWAEEGEEAPAEDVYVEEAVENAEEIIEEDIASEEEFPAEEAAPSEEEVSGEEGDIAPEQAEEPAPVEQAEEPVQAEQIEEATEEPVVEVAGYEGTSGYSGLQEAFAAAQPGDSILLLADVTVTDTIVVNKELAFDLNGHKLILAADEQTGTHGSIRVEQGILHIMDSVGEGAVENTNYGESVFNVVYDGFNPVAIDVLGGEYTAGAEAEIFNIKNSDGTAYELPEAEAEDTEEAAETVETDEEAADEAAADSEEELPVLITVTEGTFNCEIPAVFAAEGFTPEEQADGKWKIVEKTTLTVAWLNYDGSEIYTEEIEPGEIPAYTGENPEKPEDDENSYVFVGWNPQVTEVNEDTAYKAIFDADPKEKSFEITWIDGDGEVVDVEEVSQGEKLDPPEVEKEGYVLDGWYKDDALVEEWVMEEDVVTEDAALYAAMSELPETQAAEPETAAAPETQAPTTQAPETQAPTTQAPTTQAPTTVAAEEPTAPIEQPTTEAPTTAAPAPAVTTQNMQPTVQPTTSRVASSVTTTAAPETTTLKEAQTAANNSAANTQTTGRSAHNSLVFIIILILVVLIAVFAVIYIMMLRRRRR